MPEQTSRGVSGIFMPTLVALLVGMAFVVGVLWQKVNNLEKSGPTTAAVAGEAVPNPQPTVAVNIADVDTSGEPFIGKQDAPVTLAYWFDYQCPFCKQFEVDVLPDLIDKYVNSGKLKIVFKDYQFLGEDSQNVGLAAHAVWEASPENFLKWQEAIFGKQDAENSGWGSVEDIIALTALVDGVDADKVASLMESKKAEYQKEQDDDKAEGTAMGITGTPGFIVGTQNISGAQPLSTFAAAIDALLK